MGEGARSGRCEVLLHRALYRSSVRTSAIAPESAAAKNPTVKVTRVGARPDPSKVREFADDIRDGKYSLPIALRLHLSEAAEAHRLGEKGGIGKILLEMGNL